MGRNVVKYSAVLIGIYLGVYYATGSGQLVKNGSNGAIGFVKALQGR